jgi:hypothetical protein
MTRFSPVQALGSRRWPEGKIGKCYFLRASLLPALSSFSRANCSSLKHPMRLRISLCSPRCNPDEIPPLPLRLLPVLDELDEVNFRSSELAVTSMNFRSAPKRFASHHRTRFLLLPLLRPRHQNASRRQGVPAVPSQPRG